MLKNKNLQKNLLKVSTENEAMKSEINEHRDKISDLMSDGKLHQDELASKSHQVHILETQITDKTFNPLLHGV